MRCIYKGKQFSWLLALSVPPGIAGFILHTPYSFLWGIIGFILCGLIGPFLYYFVKREDLGDAEAPIIVRRIWRPGVLCLYSFSR